MSQILNKVLISTKEKRKKQFCKNRKTYAIALGITTIGTGTGLGIYYKTNTNNTSDKSFTSPDFVNAINQWNYNIKLNKGNRSTVITNNINADFIQAQLTGEVKELSNKELFKFNQVTVAGHKLNANYLKTATMINVKINYDYDTITNAETNLQITVNEKLKLANIIKTKEVKGRNAKNDLTIIPEVG